MIRAAELQDAAALAAVHLRCWLETYGQIVPPEALEGDPPDERVSRWRDTLAAGTHVLVLGEEDGSLSGFAGFGAARDDALDERTGELYGLYLLASRQRLGFGRALHELVLAGLARDGAEEAVLWTLSANVPARGFYAAAGWRLDERVTPRQMRWGLPKVRYRRELA